MRLTASDLAGLRKLYEGSGKQVWVYECEGDWQFWPLPDDEEPPEWHRDHQHHRLAGALDLMSGRVTGAQDEASGAMPGMARDWWGVLVILFKVFIGICVVSAIFILTICATFAGASGSGRSSSRHR